MYRVRVSRTEFSASGVSVFSSITPYPLRTQLNWASGEEQQHDVDPRASNQADTPAFIGFEIERGKGLIGHNHKVVGAPAVVAM